MSTTAPTLFPAVRFNPDYDEQGHILIDTRTREWKSGTLEVTLFEETNNGVAKQLGSHLEKMTFTKYRAVREDIDTMSVDELKEYFPELNTPLSDKKPELTPEQKELETLRAKVTALEEANKNEKKPTPTSSETPGKANGKSGSKKAEQTGSTSGQTDTPTA